MKAKTKLLSGVALIVVGAGIALAASSAWARHQAAVDGAAAAATAAARQALSAQRNEIESEAMRAAALEPLNAAVDDGVNGATLIDLFEDEDWWQPFRSDLAGAQLVVGSDLLAAWRQAAPGPEATGVVKTARTQRFASALATVGNQPVLLGAARLAKVSEGEPVLLLVRRYRAPLAAPPPALGPPLSLAAPPFPWIVGGALALAGLGLIIGSRPFRRRDAFRTLTSVHVPWQPAPDSNPGALPRATITPSLPPAESSPLAFGRYRLLDRLGEGGMSEVYTAESSGVEGFTRTFVLKRLRPELARDKEAVAQFINEARTQASLVHSNIVPVFDFGMVEGEYFMTEEYIVGRDLTRLLGRHQDLTGRALDLDVGLYVAHETLQALSYAHRKRDRNGLPLNIVHRDVSPGNIIASLAGEVKLSDFGIAKATTRVNSTQMGMVKGNANFMSPEQARGHAVDARSDLFSLGEVLYYCLTGELFYGGENDLDVLFKAATGPTDEHWGRIRSLPEPAADLLERALAFDPRARFQSAAEFGEAIAAVTHTSDGKARLMKLMPTLFGDELRTEAA
jgi:hypothetical protein